MKYLILLLLVGLGSCETKDDPYVPPTVTGYAPVYASRDVVNTVGIQPVRTTSHPGKIYAYGNYLFQVEQNEGIHIIDNANPQQVHKIGFLKVPMCTEISIRSGYLYTNNLNDLVVFNIANIANPQLVKRVAEAFPVIDQTYPPGNGSYFECPDPSKGIVVGWEEKTLTNPKCRR